MCIRDRFGRGGNAALATQGGISSLSNKLGFRPLGSYEQERRLKSDGTNIGTSGIGDFCKRWDDGKFFKFWTNCTAIS